MRLLHRILQRAGEMDEECLRAKGNSAKHVRQTGRRLRKLFAGCGFTSVTDLDGAKVVEWLAKQRASQKQFSNRTSNFNQDAAKSFCRWPGVHGRIPRNPLAHLKRVNVDTDIRHPRRAVAAAEDGPVVESIAGPDRAMLYVLAAWTGDRCSELASLTPRSLDLDSDPPSVKVEAGYSKRRKEDRVPLHPVVAERLRNWLTAKEVVGPGEPLFPLRLPSGHFRKTAKMMRKDLQRAREKWIEDAGDDEVERTRRENSDFLVYRNESGLYADFHAHRHTFISALGRSNIPPKLAQTLARHSDIRLTMNVYTHVEQQEQAAAVNTLPAPPDSATTEQPAGDSNDHEGEKLALWLAQKIDFEGRRRSADGSEGEEDETDGSCRNSGNAKTLGNACRRESGAGRIHPEGVESPHRNTWQRQHLRRFAGFPIGKRCRIRCIFGGNGGFGS